MRHIPALDGIRGIAILLVVLIHTNDFPFGFVGVDLFFVLSGFLITTILIEAKQRRHDYFRNFYARRVLRIFPLYYAALAVLTVTGLLTTGHAWYWSHTANVLIARDGFGEMTGHFWSLAVEEQFYLIWPLAVWMLSLAGMRRLAWGLVIAAPFSRAVAWGAYFLGGAVAQPIAVYVLTPFRMDALAAGALIALTARTEDGVNRLRRAVPVLAIGGGILITALWLRHGFYSATVWDVQIVGFTANAAVAAALVIYGAINDPRALSPGWLVSFGTLSYCLYIVHVPISRLFVHAGVPQGPQLFAAVMVVSYAVAWLSWRVLERPVAAFKQHFDGQRDHAQLDRDRTPGDDVRVGSGL